MADSTEPETAFNRWQKTSLDHQTTVAMLLIGMSGTILAFEATSVLDDKVKHIPPFLITSIVLLTLSFIAGLTLLLNRGRDFRSTANAARLRAIRTSSGELWTERVRYTKLGKLTRFLTSCQQLLFGLGLLSLAVWWLTAVAPKLF